MATMNISLPEPMKDWVEAQARTGRYSNASDYVRDLIRRDQERAQALAELQRLITDGIERRQQPFDGRDPGDGSREGVTRFTVVTYRTTIRAEDDMVDISSRARPVRRQARGELRPRPHRDLRVARRQSADGAPKT